MYIFKFKVFFSIFCLFLFILCCALGNWQLHRYHYKKDLLLAQQNGVVSKPFLTAFRSGDDLQFQRVTVGGYYRNDLTMLLQNRMQNGRLGFEVVTPLQIEGEKRLLLVDRGWVQKPRDQNFPRLEPVRAKQFIAGDIKLLNEYQFILGKNILTPVSFPLMLQKLDVAEIERVTQQAFFPFVLRLGEDQPNGFARHWVVTTVPPARHMAYAVQWFVLAVVVLVAYLCFCCERVKNDK